MRISGCEATCFRREGAACPPNHPGQSWNYPLLCASPRYKCDLPSLCATPRYKCDRCKSLVRARKQVSGHQGQMTPA